MILSDVMDEVGDLLDTIDGLRVYRWPTGQITPPAAVVGYPESYNYDLTMRRGQDQMILPVVVVVGVASERASRDNLAVYLDGSGAKSIKNVLRSESYDSFDSLRVTDADIQNVILGGTDYIAAVFNIDIAGVGETA